MEKLIKKYIKKDNPEILHDLRVYARKSLSHLALGGKSDEAYEMILKNSSKLRDTDVLMQICKKKKILKHLQKKHKKLRKNFLKFLKNVNHKISGKEINSNKTGIQECLNILKSTFLGKDDKTLHKIRIEVKKCRYTNPEYEKYLKKIQDNLGLAHDYYKCEKLMKKFNYNPKKTIFKKLKYIKKAEKARKKFINYISTLPSSS